MPERHTTWSKRFAIFGTVVTYAPLPIFLLVIGKLVADLPHITEAANGDPTLIAAEMSQRLVPVILALVVALFGFIVAVGTAALGSYHRKWLFWSLLVASLLYLAVVPFGTMLSVGCWLVLWRKRYRFRSTPTSPHGDI